MQLARHDALLRASQPAQHHPTPTTTTGYSQHTTPQQRQHTQQHTLPLPSAELHPPGSSRASIQQQASQLNTYTSSYRRASLAVWQLVSCIPTRDSLPLSKYTLHLHNLHLIARATSCWAAPAPMQAGPTIWATSAESCSTVAVVSSIQKERKIIDRSLTQSRQAAPK